MVTAAEKAEIVGRLWLWQNVVEEIIQLLGMADRAHAYSKSPEARARATTVTYGTPFAINPAFPTWTEALRIRTALIGLAVVYFGQIFKDGNKDEGKVARNLSPTLKKLRTGMLRQIGEQDLGTKVVSDFLEELKTLRDRTLAHAEGEAFEVEHGDTISKMRMMGYGLEDVDIALWIKIAHLMREYILAQLLCAQGQ